MNRQYIGARYVPKFFENPNGSNEWLKNTPYEALTIVTYLGSSYTSKKTVPIGVDILNTEYWALTGNYNAQVQEYLNKVSEYSEKIENYISYNALNALEYGIKLNSPTLADDINAMISKNPYTTIYFPKGTYEINKSILLSVPVNLVFSPFAIIRASNWVGEDYILKITVTENTNYLYKISVSGGCFDCNSYCNGLFLASNYRTVSFNNFFIDGVSDSKVGIIIGSSSDYSSDCYIDNILVKGATGSMSTGLILNSLDNNVSNFRTLSTAFGVVCNGGGQILNTCHPVCGGASTYSNYENTIGFDLVASNNYLTNCYADNYSTGFMIRGVGGYATTKRETLTDCLCYWYDRNDEHKHIAVYNENAYFYAKVSNIWIDFPTNGDNYFLFMPQVSDRLGDFFYNGEFTLESTVTTQIPRLKYPITDLGLLGKFKRSFSTYFNNGDKNLVVNKWYPIATFLYPNLAPTNVPIFCHLNVGRNFFAEMLLYISATGFDLWYSKVVCNDYPSMTVTLGVGNVDLPTTSGNAKGIMLFAKTNTASQTDYITLNCDENPSVIPYMQLREYYTAINTSLYGIDSIPNQYSVEKTLSVN